MRASQRSVPHRRNKGNKMNLLTHHLGIRHGNHDSIICAYTAEFAFHPVSTSPCCQMLYYAQPRQVKPTESGTPTCKTPATPAAKHAHEVYMRPKEGPGAHAICLCSSARARVCTD